ncbi:MAG: transcription termination factor Rho [candidate division WOR-3 bacterium]|nr:transcription termination factor Rho [candidate division WOR-3 bacterium]
MYILKLQEKEASGLIYIARRLGIPFSGMNREELIFSILREKARKEGRELIKGVIEVLSEGFGFLRSQENDYTPSPDDIYVAPSIIKRFGIRTGDTLIGSVSSPQNSEKYQSLETLESINFIHPDKIKERTPFRQLTPLHPNEKINLETEDEDISMRIIDLIAPIGKGQRGLIVSPPKAGKTVLLKKTAHSITTNHPDIYLIVLLIDERPEEVTDMDRSVKGEVLSSTFDQPPQRHLQVANIALEKAKRYVESGRDVVILLDSITRYARANNLVVPHSGRTLSGGVDSNALRIPKRFFGAARNIEGGGSLTILATALIETGSRMDSVIFEEFKGTGNQEIVLDRNLSDQRIFPALDALVSGTRKEELLHSPEVLNRVWVLRKILSEMEDNTEAMEFLCSRMKGTKNNKEFLRLMTA